VCAEVEGADVVENIALQGDDLVEYDEDL